MRNCCDCKYDILCEICDKLINQKNEFSANLNEFKRETPNKFGRTPLK